MFFNFFKEYNQAQLLKFHYKLVNISSFFELITSRLAFFSRISHFIRLTYIRFRLSSTPHSEQSVLDSTILGENNGKMQRFAHETLKSDFLNFQRFDFFIMEIIFFLLDSKME